MCRTCEKYKTTIYQQEMQILKLERELEGYRDPLTVVVEFEDDNLVDLAQERSVRRSTPAA